MSVSNPGNPEITLDQLDIETGLEVASEGKYTRDIADALGISVRQYNRLLRKHPDFERAMVQARAQGMHILAEKLATLVEDHPITEIEDLRLMFDTKKWHLSKVFPSVYGDKVAIQVEYVDVAGAMNAAKERALKVINPILELPDPFA